MMAIDPFRLRAVKFAATQCMASNEQVVCVDGCSNFLYFGTTHGNIVRLELQEHEDTEVRDVMQLPTKSAITQLLAASAVECLIVVSASKIFYVDINSLQILSAGVSSSVICIALNTNPVTEDPFALHIAVATSNRMILVCEKSERNSFVRQRITTDDNVIAICYSKNCICYATQNEYFVYNINGNVTLSLFPYDIATTTPLIVNIDTEEFLVSGMQGLAIFATSAGVSSRPPLFWGADRIVSTAYHSPYIFALNSSSLIVFKCNEASEVHRMSVVEGSIVSNVTGRVVLCVKNQISLIEEISWFDRAEALLTQSCIDDALKLAEESVLSASYDEAEILRLNRLKQKAALIYFRDEQFEKCSDMATSAEVDPRELIFHYGHLELPLVPFQVSDFNTAAVGEVDTTSERHLGFLQKYLLRVRNLHWTRAYKRDLDTALVCLLSRHGGLLEEKSLSELSCSLHDCKEWMRARNCLRFYVSVAFECDNMEDAFETCHELSDIGRFDADLHQLCLRNFTRIMDVKILLHSLEFLLRFDAASTVRSLESVPIQVDPREIVKYLEPYRDEHIIYLQRMRPLQIAELDTKLAILYIEEISRLLLDEGNDNIQKIKQYRTNLRHLFFESHYMEKVKVAEKMKGSPAFAVETIILKGKDSASEECLETLLNEYREFDAAELYCFYMNAHNKRLFRILLKSYLKIVATQPEFKSRIVNMLQSMNEPGDELEIIAEFPDDWPLQTLSSFASKALSAYDYRLHCDKLRTAALSVALRHLTSELREGASTKISIDDHTRCAVCGNLIGNEEVAVYPHSNTLAHRSCTNCSHLCPEMDTAG